MYLGFLVESDDLSYALMSVKVSTQEQSYVKSLSLCLMGESNAINKSYGHF